MTTVYVLTSEPKGYDDSAWVMGVFSTHAQAYEWVTKCHPDYEHVSKSSYGDACYEIEAFELDPT